MSVPGMYAMTSGLAVWSIGLSWVLLVTVGNWGRTLVTVSVFHTIRCFCPALAPPHIRHVRLICIMFRGTRPVHRHHFLVTCAMTYGLAFFALSSWVICTMASALTIWSIGLSSAVQMMTVD